MQEPPQSYQHLGRLFGHPPTLFEAGRYFYGTSIAALGLLTVYYHKFPYMLILGRSSAILAAQLATYATGLLLIVTGIFIDLKIKLKTTALLFGSLLLLIFCFYHLPYQFSNPGYMSFGAWENAEKELALSGGAFVIAGNFQKEKESRFILILAKLIPAGVILYSIPIFCFGVDHFLYARAAATYIPSYIPDHLFWIYFAGTALLGAVIGILLGIKRRLMAILLGSMIFAWFILLHIPKVVDAHFSDAQGEVTSAFLALAYSGIAFAIAGNASKRLFSLLN